MLNKIKGLVKEEQGQGMTEYGLLLAVVIVVVVGCLATFNTQLTALLKKVTDAITAAVSKTPAVPN